MLKTIPKPTEEGMALRCRSLMPPKFEIFFHGNLCLRNTFVVPKRVFSHPTYTFHDSFELGCKSKGASLLHPSHKAALVYIHMDAARYDPNHSASFHPSTLSITATPRTAFPFSGTGVPWVSLPGPTGGCATESKVTLWQSALVSVGGICDVFCSVRSCSLSCFALV